MRIFGIELAQLAEFLRRFFVLQGKLQIASSFDHRTEAGLAFTKCGQGFFDRFVPWIPAQSLFCEAQLRFGPGFVRELLVESFGHALLAHSVQQILEMRCVRILTRLRAEKSRSL